MERPCFRDYAFALFRDHVTSEKVGLTFVIENKLWQQSTALGTLV
jgi:hypothetical protein